MRLKRTVWTAVLYATIVANARATVVPAMSFDALLAEADTVFRGEVVSVEPRWIDYRGNRGISTLVVFRVNRVLKGEAAQQITLDFLGGTIGDMSYEIQGVPRFRIGDRAVLFVRQGLYVSPVVGFSQGRFRIQRDIVNGVDVVTTHDGRAFAAVRDIGALRSIGSAVRTLRLDEFEQTILQGVARARR